MFLFHELNILLHVFNNINCNFFFFFTLVILCSYGLEWGTTSTDWKLFDYRWGSSNSEHYCWLIGQTSDPFIGNPPMYIGLHWSLLFSSAFFQDKNPPISCVMSVGLAVGFMKADWRRKLSGHSHKLHMDFHWTCIFTGCCFTLKLCSVGEGTCLRHIKHICP